MKFEELHNEDPDTKNDKITNNDNHHQVSSSVYSRFLINLFLTNFDIARLLNS